MARRPVKKATSGVTKATTKTTTKAAPRKTVKKSSPKASATPTAKPAKRSGDVLGLSAARPPKGKSAAKKTGSARKRKSIGVTKRATGIDHLNPARVRG